jgi:hypothetical protein
MADEFARGREVADIIHPHVPMGDGKLTTLSDDVLAQVRGVKGYEQADLAMAQGAHSKYGRTFEPNKKGGDGKWGHRKFGARTPMEHAKAGAHSWAKYSLMSPLAWSIHAAIGIGMSGDNLFDPYDGFARHAVGSFGAEAGFFAGGTLGAMAATAVFSGGVGAVAAGAAYLVGAMFGADMAGRVADAPWAIAETGRKWGREALAKRSSFQDSEHAYTMRQRAMQSIYRSQMNARSALGQEALAYHG